MKPRHIEALVVALFITVMGGANLLIAAFGPWLLPVTAFVSVGMVLVSRDYLHDTWRTRGGAFWPRMLAMIAAAALLAFLVDPTSGRVGLASIAALISSTVTETVAFQTLFTRPWMIRSNGSNIVGALVDSTVFPLVAFGLGGVDGLLLLILTQTATKTLGGLFWSSLFRVTLKPDERRARQAARQAAHQVAA